MVARLSRENRLLLLSASTRHTEGEKNIIQGLVRETTDWAYLLDVAEYHRLLPLLYKTLSSVCPELVPQNVMASLNQYYKTNAARNFLMAGTILRINSICQINKIETLPIKGPLLSAVVYGDFSLRSFSDIDILVRERDIQKLIDLLLQEKYRLYPPGISLDIFLKFLRVNHDGRLLTDKGFLFELHRDLADWYTPKEMTFERLTPYLRETEFLGYPVKEMCPEMLLAYLALHGNKHGWVPLEQLCCIAELIRKEQTLDWDLLFGIAGDYKIVRRVNLTLRLVHVLFEINLPEGISRKVADKKIDALANTIIEKIADRQGYLARFRDKARYHRKLMDRRRDLLSFLMKGLAAPGTDDWEHLAMPLPLFSLYYIYKPLRIIFTPHEKSG